MFLYNSLIDIKSIFLPPLFIFLFIPYQLQHYLPKTPEKSSQLQDDKIKQVEGERILKYIKQDAFKIALEIDGKQLSSEELANKLANVAVNGYSNIQFIIGGSLGLASNVCKIADMHLSFSKMTFPHQLMRVILLEQIYRTYRINNNEPYHK